MSNADVYWKGVQVTQLARPIVSHPIMGASLAMSWLHVLKIIYGTQGKRQAAKLTFLQSAFLGHHVRSCSYFHTDSHLSFPTCGMVLHLE